MEFDYAVEQIMSRVRELRFGAVLTYDEVNEWLKISSGDDLMWAYDKLSDRLIMEHSICLELKKDWIITAVPDDSDIKAVEKRNGINLNNVQ
ncbi:MAG: hypothetical protein DRJ13_01540 [Bacteroidetes bacterium]|nr:MAG: hypothetical protein DRJ13_01540 [Bacteroidota bacterium]